jgi:hypothetical protein
MFSEYFDFFFRQLFCFNKIVAGVSRMQNELIELRLDCNSIPILGVLQNKHHEERENGRSRIDDKLPKCHRN